MGLTYREYADRFERVYERALDLARAGLTPHEAARKAIQEGGR